MNHFMDIVGHQDIIEYIGKAVTHHQVSHAYILNGEKGSGKKMLAKLFAMSLQCIEPKENGEPCGTCKSCHQAMHRNHPDIIYVEHEKANSIGIEEIRQQINQDIAVKPYASNYKVYIVDEADKMTVQAQNALLKTMEEPPEYAVLLLLTENAESLLPTIRSRCVMLKLRHIKDQLVKKYLIENLSYDEEKADICVAFAQGNIGKAVRLASSESFQEMKDDVVSLMKQISRMDLSQLLEYLNRCKDYKLCIDDYMDLIAVWYRDVLIYKATKNIDRVIFSNELSAIKERANTSSYEGIETVLEALEKVKTRLKANVNYELVMELLLLTIQEN
jgi:DNA polymerase-3 subunit delta'